MSKKLVLQFKNDKNSTSTLTLGNVIEPVDQVKVQTVMEKIAASNLFVDKSGNPKFLMPLAAKVVNTVADELFNFKK